ncbi:hypothetical protein Tco_1113686 [Tanacetum coccineum]|uniref:Uncharacterized protein n=1 Tax=Tanacetum coccineum TaxID=301880 RepID=A0ABQ5IVV3_9ASTR
MAEEDKFHDDNPPPPPVTPTQQAHHTRSTTKLPILKKGEYDIWAMKMKHYSGHTDYPIWEIIQKGNGPVQVSTDTNGQINVLPPKTAEEILARERKESKNHLAYGYTRRLFSKQQFESFSVFNSEGLHKRLGQSLPHPGPSILIKSQGRVDTLSFDDLYNNLRVFESDIKGSTASSSSTQNVAFVSSESTNSTNDVSTAYGVSTSSGHNSQKEGPSSYTDELKRDGLEMASGHDFHETKEVLQEDREKAAGTLLESADQKEIKKAEEEMQGTLDIKQKTIEVDLENRRNLKLCNSGLDTEVTSCSKECVESYAKLKKLYDEQREQLGDASIEIQAYTQALKKVEAQLVVAHQKNQLSEAVKEKEELKTKLENFQSSSKGLSKLLNSQMSTRDKSGLGYGNQIHEGVLSYEKEVLESVFDSRSSDVEDSPVYDRFAKVEGMHAVPPPMTGNYMPPKSDFGIDESNFTYGPKQSKTSESDAKTSDFDSCETNSSVETLESVPEPVVVEPKVVSQPKVWSDALIIEEYESDSDDKYMIEPSKEQEKPSFAFVNTVKHVKTPRKTIKKQNTCSPSPKVNKRDWNGSMYKRLGLGYGFTKKACFICGSFSHLIRDCDFHEKRMAKHVELNKQKGKGTGQGENRPVWNNVQRLNHQNKFVPKTVLTKTGIFSVNTARQNPFSQAAETSTARKVNTARSIVNEIRLRNNFYKSHLPIRRPFNKSTAAKAKFTNNKVNTVGDKIVSAVRGYRETAVKASAVELTASIDGQAKTITKASLRRHLKLEDNGGISSLPNTEIFEQLALMGTFNFLKFIFDAMLKNLDNPHKFLMYPRFIQICLNKQRRLLQPHTRTYPTTVLTQKVFSNMKRVTKGYSGEDIPLFPSMITAPETSTSRITSSPFLSLQHTPVSAPSTSPPPIIETTPTAEEPALMEESLIEELDLDAEISLVPPHDAKIQEKISDDTEVLLEEEEIAELVEEPTELVEDQGSGEKGEHEVTTADTPLNTASVPISTASATPKIDEEERKRIARDAEIAKQLQKEYDKAGKKEAVAEVDTAHVIDWNDPSVIRYHALQHRPRSVAEVRKNMIITKEVAESVQEQTDEEPKTDELSQEQLNQMVIIVLDEGINVEALQTKYPIIGWEVYSEDTMQFWKIIRVGNYTKMYQVFEDMLKNFDRDDLVKLWSLVQERYNSSRLTKYKEIELWVELKMLFEPDAENLLELQKYMHDPLKWWLYDMCAVHYVSTEKGQDIFMLVE